MRLALLWLCGCLLILPSAAHAADEQLISSDAATGLTAQGPWVAWIDNVFAPPSSSPKIWDGSVETDLVGIPGRFALGSDKRGHAALTYTACRRTRPLCAVVQRDPYSNRRSVLLRDRAQITVVTSERGYVAYTRNFRLFHQPGPGSGLYLRRRGAHRASRVSRDEPDSIDIAAGRLVYITSRPVGPDAFDTVIRVLDLATRKWRLIASVSDAAADCRCTDSTLWVDHPRLDGHYLYWLTTITHTLNPEVDVEIDRLDLTEPDARPLAFHPSRDASSLAVFRGVMYYSAGVLQDPVPGVYRVVDPLWQATNLRLPIH